MLFTHLFAIALALVPAVQVFAAPASMIDGLSIREPPSPSVRAPMTLDDILARTCANIGIIKSQLNSGDPHSAEVASIKLKATVDNLVGDLKSLKKAKTNGQNVRPGENGIFNPTSWPIVDKVFGVVKDVLTLVDQIRAVAASQSTGDKLNGVVEILKTIVKATQTVVSIILSILPYF
ncbi:hypothetical protein FS749_010135 [Ceratobasidium sp. UAMH 11750]|nr:hypothetical protein FS749_010135 [Ceratobasidium sp. UAMH 11750]